MAASRSIVTGLPFQNPTISGEETCPTLGDEVFEEIAAFRQGRRDGFGKNAFHVGARETLDGGQLVNAD